MAVATLRGMVGRREAGVGESIVIVDPADPRLADFVGLRDAALRRRVEHERGVFIAEGRLAIEALVASGYEVRAVLVNEKARRRLAATLAHVVAPVYVVDDAVMAHTVGFDLHRGAVASAVRPADTVQPVAAVVPETARRLLVCEGVNDHENLGALFRNAAAFGVDAVLLDATTADPLYRRSVRVSLGDSPDAVLMRGGSAIVSPLGKVLAGPNFEGETILTADLDLAEIGRGKFDFDAAGHYSRPDVFQLIVNEQPMSAVIAKP